MHKSVYAEEEEMYCKLTFSRLEKKDYHLHSVNIYILKSSTMRMYPYPIYLISKYNIMSH